MPPDPRLDIGLPLPATVDLSEGSEALTLPPDPILDADAPASAGDPLLTGKYRLLQILGEGGMGTVFLAEQIEPVQRRVAVKLIKLGLDSAPVLARFEADRQALAVMDHPHIAKVHDAGVDAGGQPFFVMELVEGVPLTRFCDEARLTVRERLELFVPICQAVQHAHQKGVIHRDLKPSNLLVARCDGKPVPKIIDFGIAKAAGTKLTARTMETQVGSVMGTLEYMSPEQAGGGQDIDTRADIYSLGVILYELLTGTTPLGSSGPSPAMLVDVLMRICEEEPPRPSVRLGALETAPNIAAMRQTEPARLAKLLRGDLDWIVMKALEKDRGRRYETANGLAMDVQRYLADEPVSAGPPSAGYRLRKFVKRNRGTVAAAALLLVALLVGVMGTSLGLLEARRQGEEAEHQKQKAEVQRDRAMKAETEAKHNAERAKREEARARTGEEKAKEEESRAKQSEAEQRAVLAFLLNKLLAAARPRGHDGGLGVDATIRAAVDAAEPQIAEAFRDQPLVEALIRDTLGVTYEYLGEPKLAIRQLERAMKLRKAKLGTDHIDTLNSMSNLANAYTDAKQWGKALPLAEHALTARMAKLGDDHPDTLVSMNILAGAYRAGGRMDKALPLLEKCLEKRKAVFGPDHADTLRSMNNLAVAYSQVGLSAKEALLHEQILVKRISQLGSDHPDTLLSLNNLATVYWTAGRLDKALPLLEQVLEKRKAVLGMDHRDTLTSLNSLARVYQEAGRLNKAVPLLEQTLDRFKRTLGPDDTDTLGCMSNLAVAYTDAGQLNKALPLAEQTLAKRKAKFGENHPDTLVSMNVLAGVYRVAGQWDKALPLLELTLAKRKAVFGHGHPNTLRSMNNLAVAYWSAGKRERSLNLLHETLNRTKDKLGEDNPETLRTMANLGRCYRDAGRLQEAIPLLETALKRGRQKPGGLPASIALVPSALAETYDRAGQFAKAETIYRDFLRQAEKQLGRDDPRMAAVMAKLGDNLLKQKKYPDAASTLRQCLTAREKKQPDDWTTFNTRSALGEALAGQKKFAEAEPLLLQGYEGMNQRRDKIPPLYRSPHLRQAIERLVHLYDGWGKTDKAELWRNKLAKLKRPNHASAKRR